MVLQGGLFKGAVDHQVQHAARGASVEVVVVAIITFFGLTLYHAVAADSREATRAAAIKFVTVAIVTLFNASLHNAIAA